MLQKPEDSISCVVEDSQWMDYGFALDALTMEPTGFCRAEFLQCRSDGVE